MREFIVRLIGSTLCAAVLLGAAPGLAPAESSLDLNRATVEELVSLPGIGESRAEAIVAYRTEHGAFERVDELVAIKGIGPSLVEKLADRVTIGSPAN